MTEQVAPLVPFDMYRTHAVHIGTNQKSADMNRFLDTDRQDGTGLHLIDIEKTDERIRVVASFLNRYDPSRVLVVSARQYGQRPARKFAQAIGAKRIVGRFIPGTLTNPRLSSYIEPEVLMVTDPSADSQALNEAISSGIPEKITLQLQKNYFKAIHGHYEKFSDWLFLYSAKFLKSFSFIGWNYVLASVIICGFIPLIILSFLIYLAFK